MPQTVLITLSTAGPLTGPFDLYCVDAFGNTLGPAFEQNISKSALIAGYTSNLVPNGCERIRIQSDNKNCDNFIDLVIPPTTSTTSTTSSTTTSTTSTTTTTTINPLNCKNYTLAYISNPQGIASFQFIACGNTTPSVPITITSGLTVVCAVEGSVNLLAGNGSITVGGSCLPPTTTTTSTTTSSTTTTTTEPPVDCGCYSFSNSDDSVIGKAQVDICPGQFVPVIGPVTVPFGTNTLQLCGGNPRQTQGNPGTISWNYTGDCIAFGEIRRCPGDPVPDCCTFTYSRQADIPGDININYVDCNGYWQTKSYGPTEVVLNEEVCYLDDPAYLVTNGPVTGSKTCPCITTTTSTTSTSTTTTTTAAPTTTTTTTCPPGQLIWSINGISGGEIKITRLTPTILLVDQISNTGPHSGTITNAANFVTYEIEALYYSGSNTSIKMRICDITNLTEVDYVFGNGPGTSLNYTLTIGPCETFRVSVTAGNATPLICPT